MARFLRDERGRAHAMALPPVSSGNGTVRILVIQPQAPLLGNWTPPPVDIPNFPGPIVLNEALCRTVDFDGYYEIHRAAAAGDHLLVQQILEDGSNLCLQRGNTPRPYRVNVSQKIKPAWKKLRLPGTNRRLFFNEFRLALGVTPLDLAIFYGHVNVVRVLLLAGACSSGNALEIFNGLLYKTAKTSFLRTTLQFAFQERRDQVAELLVGEKEFLLDVAQENSDNAFLLEMDILEMIRRLLSHPNEARRNYDHRRYLAEQRAYHEEYMVPLMAAEPEALDRILQVANLRAWLSDRVFDAPGVMTTLIVGAALARLIETYNARSRTLGVAVWRTRAIRRVPRLMFILKKHNLLDTQALASIFIWTDEGLLAGILAKIPPQHKHEDLLELEIRDVYVLLASAALCGIRPPDVDNYEDSLLENAMLLLVPSGQFNCLDTACIDVIELILKTCHLNRSVLRKLRQDAMKMLRTLRGRRGLLKRLYGKKLTRKYALAAERIFDLRKEYLRNGGATYFSRAAVSARLAAGVHVGHCRRRRGAQSIRPSRSPYVAIQATWTLELRRILPELRQSDMHLLNVLPLEVIRGIYNYCLEL